MKKPTDHTPESEKAPQNGKRKRPEKLSRQFRKEAEKKLTEQAVSPDITRNYSADKLLYELQVHQIELEMQNEALIYAQTLLEESRDNYRDCFDFASVGYLTLSYDNLIADINLTAAAMLGSERIDLILQRFPLWIADESREDWERHFRQLKQHGEKQSCELLMQRGDGSTFHAHLDCHIATNSEPAKAVRIALIDISERKAMEQALRNSETHLRLSQSGGGIGTWETDLVTNKLTWSETCITLLGLPNISAPTWEDFLAVVHPEDRQRVIDATQAHLERGTLLDVVYRVIVADGNIRWLRSAGQAKRNENGQPVIMRGIVQNVTDRRKSQQQLEKSLSLLYATLESCNDGILVVDLDRTWVLHNQRFADLWQIPEDITATKDDYKALAFVSDQLDDPEAFLQKVRELYADPEASSFDRIKFKDGKSFERYSIPQRIDGKVVGRVWNFHDVTERETAAQKLKKEADKNLALLRNASDGIHIVEQRRACH